MAVESVLNLDELRLRPVERREEPVYRQLMAAHLYLGLVPKIGHTLWYVATYQEQWVALLNFSAAAWKRAVRDRWIGWDFHHQYGYDRLKLIANNSRFLILPHWHRPNLGSKILSLCQKRLARDWQERFGYPLLLLETFVDPQRFQGTVYHSAHWSYVGLTRGYRRTRQGYSATALSPKKVFVKPLQSNARTLLARRVLPLSYRQGVPKMMLSAQQMRSLPDCLSTFLIHAVPKDDVIPSVRCWPSPVGRLCVACAVTRRSRTGGKVSVPKPERDWGAVVSTGATWYRANR